MAQFKGTIQKINKTPYKNKTMYSLALKGQDGLFGNGANPIPFPEGTYVQFESELNAKGYQNIVEGTLVQVDNGQPVETSSPSAKTWSTNGKTQEEKDFWTRKEGRETEKDKKVSLHGSINSAISFVDLLIKHDAVKLPAAPAKKEAIILEMVNRYTGSFYNKINNLAGDETLGPDVEEASEAPVTQAEAASADSNENNDSVWE